MRAPGHPSDVNLHSRKSVKTLNLAADVKSERKLLAKKIIAIAQGGERSTTVLRERVLKDIRVGRIRGGVVAGASVLPSPWTLSKSAEAESCLYLAKATQSLVFVLAHDRRPVGASPLALLVAATIDLSQCSPAVCSDDAVVSGC